MDAEEALWICVGLRPHHLLGGDRLVNSNEDRGEQLPVPQWKLSSGSNTSNKFRTSKAGACL